MEFRLLGPVEAWAADRPIALGGSKPRALLATLLIDHGRVVPVDRLVDAIWGSAPPGTARALVQTYVSSLRHAMAAVGGEDVIVTQPPGYLLRLEGHALDRDAFERLLADGREARVEGRDRDASELLRAAAALWRGAPMGGVDSPALASEAARLTELRLVALEERLAADLALGRLDEVTAELAGLVRRYPFRERLRGQLMIAMSRLGRQTEALAVFREGRDALVDELGIEPGPELAAIHEAVLRGDTKLVGPARDDDRLALAAHRGGPPAQLPPVPADFTGRRAEIAALAAGLAPRAGAVPVQVIVGKGGAGKSALATRVAHEVAENHPDGQLFAELRGMSDTPAEPREVLGRFLLALGLDPQALPESFDERIERYRTMISGRRVLIVLDDAADERQVRPLLPGMPTCGVIITSRARLGGLAGATPTELDVLGENESTELLNRIVGGERVSAEAGAAARIVRQCGGLPLAIRVAGARLAARRAWPLTILADRLADERRRLDELAVGDQEVRASIELSYRALGPTERVGLRQLGAFGLPEFPSWIVGPLLEVSDVDAEQIVERLVDAQLVDFVRLDGVGQLRYRLHDLVRLYARERAEAEEDAAVRRAAVTRVVGTWLWLIEAITAGAPNGEFYIRGHSTESGYAPEELTRRVLAQPRVWFDAEQSALIAAVERAAAMDLDQLACDLASGLSAFEYLVANRFEARTRTHDAALAAARRAGNRNGEAMLLAGFGRLRYAQDRYVESREYFWQALDAFRETDDRRGEAATLAGLGATCREQGYLSESLHFLNSAAVLLGELGDDSAIGNVQRLAGSVRMELGDYPGALRDLRGAIEAYRRVGSRRGEALSLRTLAMYHRAKGDYAEAVDLCEQALAGFREVGDELLEAYGRRALGKALIRLDRPAEARTHVDHALATIRAARDRWGEAATVRVLGELALAEGRLDEAERELEAAIRQWDALGLPLYRARTLRDLARVHAARGDAAEAAKIRNEALVIFERFGTRELAELTEEIRAGSSQP